MPPARARHDVPELHGDARGKRFDARPRTVALGNARWSGHRQTWMARGSGERRARSLSRVQRLQSGLPGECGHGDIQSGIFVALFPKAVATTACLRLWFDSCLVAIRAVGAIV